MMRIFTKSNQVALLLVGSAILLSACQEPQRPVQETPAEKLMTEYSENRTIIATENGKKQYQFFAPLLEGYTAGDEPYREFRRGIRMTTFQKDSTDLVDVTLTANYAIFYEKRKLWEAKGNVVVRKSDGKTLYTEQLFWNDITNKIYSNVDAKIVENGGETYVSGFESDEEFRYWSAREMDGRMEVEFTPTAPDSTAVQEPNSSVESKQKVVHTKLDSDAKQRREEARKRSEEQRKERQRQAAERAAKRREEQQMGPKRPAGAPANNAMRRPTTEVVEKSMVEAPLSFSAGGEKGGRVVPKRENVVRE